MTEQEQHDFAAARAACMANPITPEIKLATLITTYRKWLHLPDPGPVYFILGSVAANLMQGDPVWSMLIGAPGSGKTELLQPLSSLANVHFAGTITEPALLSGTAARDRAKDAKGGLLAQIGKFGILICKDFTSVLSMHRDSRAALLAALRETFDGNWTRHVGVDGGRTLHWSGKLALIAACTPIIDSHHAVMAAMGERFILYRLPPVDESEQARRALSHCGCEAAMRSELTRAAATLFSEMEHLDGHLGVEKEDQARLIALTTFAVRCRSAVERDGHSREIELIPDPEAPSRLTLVLARLGAGMAAIGVERNEIWRVVSKVALDCMPALRRRLVEILYRETSEIDTTAASVAIKYPTTTTRRALEDLAAHGVIDRNPQGQGKADMWALSEWTRAKCAEARITFPEMSEGTV
jgi:hypothetical protein